MPEASSAAAEPVRARPLPRWFDDAKLGIFVHWGPYSVPGWAAAEVLAGDKPGSSIRLAVDLSRTLQTQGAIDVDATPREIIVLENKLHGSCNFIGFAHAAQRDAGS